MSSSLFLSIIYTLGHIIIAMACNTLITGANLNLAALDALIEQHPLQDEIEESKTMTMYRGLQRM